MGMAGVASVAGVAAASGMGLFRSPEDLVVRNSPPKVLPAGAAATGIGPAFPPGMPGGSALIPCKQQPQVAVKTLVMLMGEHAWMGAWLGARIPS